MKLWIDDVRSPPNDEPWVWVKTSDDAFRVFEGCSQYITEISFDHDLGEDDDTIAFAYMLERDACITRDLGKPPYIITWRVHSMNPVGRKKLIEILESYDEFCKR